MQFDSYHIIHNMDKYYAKLFVFNYALLYGEPKRKHKDSVLSDRKKCRALYSRTSVKKLPLLSMLEV